MLHCSNQFVERRYSILNEAFKKTKTLKNEETILKRRFLKHKKHGVGNGVAQDDSFETDSQAATPTVQVKKVKSQQVLHYHVPTFDLQVGPKTKSRTPHNPLPIPRTSFPSKRKPLLKQRHSILPVIDTQVKTSQAQHRNPVLQAFKIRKNLTSRPPEGGGFTANKLEGHPEHCQCCQANKKNMRLETLGDLRIQTMKGLCY